MEAEEKKERNYTIVPLIFLIFLSIVIVVLVLSIKKITSVTPRANTNRLGNNVSINNSYIFAAPVRAKVNSDFVRITVFVLDEEGLGIPNKKISLSNIDYLTIKEMQGTTDETGKAIFDISAEKIGTYFIEAKADGETLSQKVKVVFD